MVLSVFAIPVGIWVTFSLVDFQVAWFPEGPFKRAMVQYVTPLLFSASWVFILVLFANRAAATVDAMDKSTLVIPLRMRLFYGLNAVFVLIIFVIPLSTPLVSVISAASLGWRLSTVRKSDWGEETRVSALSWVLMVGFSVFPALASAMIVPELFLLAQNLWLNYWLPVVDLLYDGSLALCTALTFGSLIFLIKTGVSEYEQVPLKEDDAAALRGIRVFEFMLFAFFSFLLWRQIEFVRVFFWAGLFVAIFVTAVNYLRGRDVPNFNSFTTGYLIAIAYLAAQLLWSTTPLEGLMKNVTLLFTALTLIVVLVITFFRVEVED